jgi:hypothetical protein
LIGQRNQILGNGYGRFATEVRSDDCVHIMGQLSRPVNNTYQSVCVLYIFHLSTHPAVLVTITRWHGSPSPGSRRSARWRPGTRSRAATS